jgi:glycosyltransferase XagB
MVWTWQRLAAVAAAGLIVGGLAIAREATLAALSGIAAVPFLCVVLLRIVALREMVLAGSVPAYREAPAPSCVGDEEAPVYSVLVPLFRETRVVPCLMQALQALDYPPAKLEVLLVLEAVDLDTQAALQSIGLPPGFRTVIVPDGEPRTKPKALNYALQFARGEFVVVYDAEDRPEPDQLRRALDMFRWGPPQLGCVQAQLNVYNAAGPGSSWFTRGSRDSSPSNTQPSSIPSCLRSRGSSCRFRWEAPPTTSGATLSLPSAGGTRSTLPRMPIWASG